MSSILVLVNFLGVLYMNVFPLRLSPKEDLKSCLENWAQQHSIQAGWIITGMGSLSKISIRYAGRDCTDIQEGDWEICSLSGTISTAGLHVHMVVSDAQGRCVGGHLMQGNIVRTTAELVLGSTETFEFSRIFDPRTGYPELHIAKK